MWRSWAKRVISACPTSAGSYQNHRKSPQAVRLRGLFVRRTGGLYAHVEHAAGDPPSSPSQVGPEVLTHAPVWGATRRMPRSAMPPRSFNPRARVGRDPGPPSPPGAFEWFQPTRPCGARLVHGVARDDVVHVSTHAPVWGATAPSQRRPEGLAAVSTHAPVWGATIDVGQLEVHAVVSTHAPVWGATLAERSWGRPWEVSTHAPVWGATLQCFSGSCCSRCFNPRARVGRDAQQQLAEGGQVVSTHAPVWGATAQRGAA